MLMVNLILVKNIYLYSYQKLLDGYKVRLLEWCKNLLDTIKTDLALLDHYRGLVNNPPYTFSVVVRYVTDRRQQTPTPLPRGQQDPYFYLS